MGRPLRRVADGLVYHAIHRGNNRDRVFYDDGDFRAFLYAAHGLGQADPLLREGPVWAGRGGTEAARQAYGRRWVHEPLTEREFAALRHSVTSGRPFGSETWAKGMRQRLGMDRTPKRRGRPPKDHPLATEQAGTEKMN